ncbi:MULTISPECIES: Mrp/NBP35 family ATP-binding protein [Persicobacter]|uniref:Iron-sulfur cluster carrier protein n=1 Tax=Persicobacter diffluens TaxID=981 RepID=A0AAN4VY10_9BACT|nr:Mrp/NBP35 family ATP-binding protein [Persicobacter sp. CCB-QB2]GJM61141.1 iron-sulfur cluster carrier protein [Persicobacter diffluens]
MTITKDQILKALGTVEDPDLKKDLVTLGMIKELEIENNTVKFQVVLTTPACPLKEQIRKSCIEAIHEQVNADLEVIPEMTHDVTAAQAATPLLPQVKNIIAVASGKGGVGKSTVSTNLAVALARTGAKVGFLDADIYGPSAPTMFNCEHEQPGMEKEGEKTWIIPIEQYGVKIMSIGFLTPPDSPMIWRGPMATSAIRQFLGDTKWGELDYMVVDLPPGTSDIHLSLIQNVAVTGAVVVTTPQKVAIMDAQKGLAMFQQPQINVPVLGMIENMAYFTPKELPENKYYIFGKDGGKEMAERFKVPFLGEIPIVQEIRESGDNGYPAVLKDSITSEAFDQLAKEVARQVAMRNATMDKTERVKITQV